MRPANQATEDRRSHNYLLVEDDDDHAELIVRGFEGKPVGRISRVKDGVEALDLLFNRGKYEKHPIPDLVLLDLKLPKMGGHLVLQAIKSDPRLKVIPVVVLTTSSANVDRTTAYQNHANSYVVKPMNHDGFADLAAELNQYWSQYNTPPTLEVAGEA